MPELSFSFSYDSLTEEIIQLTADLTAIPAQTDLDTEQAIANFVHDTLARFGLSPVLIGPEQHPSVLCTLKKGNGPVLWLESPLDTVPAGDPANWKTESPFNAEIHGDRMTGRGVADARLAIALFSVLARQLSQDSQFKGTLVLAFDADEQSGRFTGIREIIRQAPKPDGIILGYQGANEISIGARGIFRLWLKIQGLSAHPGSRSRKGVNAITIMTEALSVLRQTTLSESQEAFFPFGSQLQPTLIKGGDALNKVPDLCAAFLDIRLLPSMNKTCVLKQLNATIASVVDAFPGSHFSLEEVQYYPAFLTPPESRLVQIVHAEAQRATGQTLPLVASGPTSVGCVLAHMAPVINCFGVHSGNVHADNEWILLKDILPVYNTWYRTALNFCYLS
ncbi:MAG: M20 family metallopeptidase [Endozoicomonas sp.]